MNRLRPPSTLDYDIASIITHHFEESYSPTPPVVAGAVSFLAALSIPPHESVVSLQDALLSAMRARIGSLDLDGCIYLIGKLACFAPLVPGSQLGVLFSGLLHEVSTKVGFVAAALAGPLGEREALQNITPELVMTLPPNCRQLLWKAVPARCPSDLSLILFQFDRMASSAREPPLNLLISSRGGGLSSSSPTNSAAASPNSPSGSDVCRETRLKRRRSRTCLLLYECTRNSPPIYATAMALIQRRFEETRDPKWCTLRCDLYCIHVGTTADAPKDPLEGVILASEAFLAGAPVVPVLEAMRRFLVGYGSGGGGAGALFTRQLQKAVSETLRQARDKKESYIEDDGRIVTNEDKVSIYVKPGSKRFWYGNMFCRDPLVGVLDETKELYKKEIAHPMDLGTMNDKAKEGKYGSSEEVLADMRLIVANCRTYNEKREKTDSKRALFALVDGIESLLIANLSRHLGEIEVKLAHDTGMPTLASSPTLIMQLLMVLAEPTLTRALTQASATAISASCVAGTVALDGETLPPYLCLLVLGDLAFSSPKGISLGAPPPPGGLEAVFPSPLFNVSAASVAGHASSVLLLSSSTHNNSTTTTTTTTSSSKGAGHQDAALSYLRGHTLPPPVYTALLAATLELSACASAGRVGGVVSRGEEESVRPFPLTVALAVAALQRLFVDTELELERDAGGPPAAASSLSTTDTTASSVGNNERVEASTAALKEVVEALLSGPSPLLHRRSISYLATAVALQCRLNPSLPSHFSRLLLLASLAAFPQSPGLFEPVVVVTFLQRIAAVVQSPPRRRVGGLGEAYIPPSSLALTLLQKFLLPSVLASATSSPFRALFHDILAEFLRFLLTKRAIESNDALGLVRAALESLALPISSPIIQASLPSWPSLPLLISSGALQPIALLWMRPDFDKARLAYVRLVSRHFPDFEWASYGLNVDALSILSTHTSGDGGSHKGDSAMSENASEIG